MLVFIHRNRGAVVSDPKSFREKRPDLEVKDFKDCKDLLIKNCCVRINGEDGWVWATRWLNKGQAGERLSTIFCPATVKECGYTLKEILRSKVATEGRVHKERSRTSQRHIGQQF